MKTSPWPTPADPGGRPPGWPRLWESTRYATAPKPPLRDWEKAKWMNIRNAKAEFLGKFGGGDGTVGYPEDLRNYDKIIYTPVMKTHFLGGITMSLEAFRRDAAPGGPWRAAPHFQPHFRRPGGGGDQPSDPAGPDHHGRPKVSHQRRAFPWRAGETGGDRRFRRPGGQ